MRIEFCLHKEGDQHKWRHFAHNLTAMVREAFCCDAMAYAWNPVGLGVSFDTKGLQVGICGWATSESGPVHRCGAFALCPFCGEPIQVLQVGTMDCRIRACAKQIKPWFRGAYYCPEKAASGSVYCYHHLPR